MELILLEPAYQNYVWGGDRIPHYFNRSLPEGRYAESWEVSDRLEGMSVIGNGPLKGTSFREYLQGKKCPLLIKIIDAKENLSVQIHPDEAAAIRLGAEPKTEMWIALEKSSVYAGLKDGVTRDDFLEALIGNCVEKLMRKFVLEKGEAIFIPAGLVHAICGDSLLLEVQQNSNTTYRLYDWGRVGRQLHLEQGLSCVNWSYVPTKIRADAQIIVSCHFFCVERITVKGTSSCCGTAFHQNVHIGLARKLPKIDDHNMHNMMPIQSMLRSSISGVLAEPSDNVLMKRCISSRIFFCTSGNATIANTSIGPGQTFFIPNFQDHSIIGNCELIAIH